MKRLLKSSVIAVALMTPMTAGVAAAAPGKGNPNPAVAPANAEIHGLTYAEWGVRWWEWALSFPAARNPLFEVGAPDAPVQVTFGGALHQPYRHVWFLAGTFGGPAYRVMEVPTGTALFVPLLNWMPWTPGDCSYVIEGRAADDCTAEELLAALTAVFDDPATIAGASAELDGVPLTGLGRYRARMGEVVDYCIEEGTLAGEGYPDSVGDCVEAGSDGYYLMLHPLSRGRHTLHFAVEGFLDVTYILKVR